MKIFLILLALAILGSLTLNAQDKAPVAAPTPLPATPSAIAPASAPMVSTQVKVTYVPDLTATGGASFSALHPFPNPDSKTLAVQANAGLGDRFPVAAAGQPPAFEVMVTGGDDRHLELTLQTQTAPPQPVSLPRDKSVAATVGGVVYHFLFPTLTVASLTKESKSHQALILVERAK